MRALGVLAGPRKGRTTDKVIDSVLEGLKGGGVEVRKISLYDYDIKPCTGCCTCETGDPCPIGDDQAKVLDLMDQADIVVFGSPVYWSNITSQAKKFFDRAAGFFEMGTMGPERKKDKPSKIVLINSCGVPWPLSSMFGVTTGSFNAMKAFFSRMKVKIYKVCVPGMIDPHKSEPSKRTLNKAYALGKRLST